MKHHQAWFEGTLSNGAMGKLLLTDTDNPEVAEVLEVSGNIETIQLHLCGMLVRTASNAIFGLIIIDAENNVVLDNAKIIEA